ncbi:MAG: PEP-CTERM sorting domain-containing protein [Roseateles sp.]
MQTHCLLAGLLGLASLLATQAAHAAYTATSTVDTAAATTVNLAPFQQVVDNPAALTLTGTAGHALLNSQAAQAELLGAVLNGVGTGAAAVSVAPGAIWMQLGGSGSSNISPPDTGTRALVSSAGFASAQGSFSDTVVWQAGGLATGSLVYLDMTVRLAGSVNATANNVFGWSDSMVRYQWTAGLAHYGGGASGLREARYNNGALVADNTEFGSFTFTVAAYVGLPVDLYMSLSMDARGNGYAQCDNCNWVVNGAGAAGGSFSPGLTWGGISGARTAAGTAIALGQLSAVSASGFNYMAATPVPEPGSALLLMAGLALLGVRRLRARQP